MCDDHCRRGNLIVADSDEENGRRVAEQIRTKGGEATFVSVDVSKPEQVEKMVAEAVATYDSLQAAVNNAGIGGAQGPTGEYPIDSWHQVIGVNLDGVFYGMRYEIPAMLDSGGGSIVNIASILGSVGFGNSPAYVAAKHGGVGLTKSAAIEYSAKGIRINSVGPGFISTPLLEKNLDAATLETIATMHPARHVSGGSGARGLPRLGGDGVLHRRVLPGRRGVYGSVSHQSV